MAMSGKTTLGIPLYEDKDKTFLRSDINTSFKKIDEIIGASSGGYPPDANKGLEVADNKLAVKVDGTTIQFDDNGKLKAEESVKSVNGKTGEVVLNAEDVGAVEKEDGKGLSTNDFTDEYKNQVDTNKTNIETINTELETLSDGKVDKEEGKGLSSNDFTNGYKIQISDNTNRITDAEGRITTNENAIEGHTETLNTHEESIQNLLNEAERLENDKQDKLIVGTGIGIQDNTIRVKIDGTTIKANEEGLLYAVGNGGGGGGGITAGAGISVSGNQVSVNVDGNTIKINSNNQLVATGGGGGGYLDGGSADSTYLPTDIIDGGNA